MKAARRKELDAMATEVALYACDLASMMGLRDWHLYVVVTKKINGFHGRMTPIEGRRLARIEIGPEFKTLAPGTQRNTIVHELLHMHHRDVSEMLRLRLPKLMAGRRRSQRHRQRAYNFLWASYKDMEELAVDTQAMAIDKLFPMPPWVSTSEPPVTP